MCINIINSMKASSSSIMKKHEQEGEQLQEAWVWRASENPAAAASPTIEHRGDSVGSAGHGLPPKSQLQRNYSRPEV
jgi:hypothetical protein